MATQRQFSGFLSSKWRKNYYINYSPEDNFLLVDGTGEEDVYQQDVYLGNFERLFIPNDEVSEEINHLTTAIVLTQFFWMSLVSFLASYKY